MNKTKNNVIRLLKSKDAEFMLEWMHDSKINSNFRFDFASMTKEKVLEFIENSFDEENQHFAFINENDEYLGTISLKHISKVDKNAEYAITTRGVAQGTGITYKATMEILNYAFKELKLHKVYLNVLEENTRANAFYKKCGFTYEGQFRDYLFLRGEYKNLNWYGITENEWNKLL